MNRIVLVLVLSISFSASAASFDCQKASTEDEKAICAHLSLNDKDVEMATKYQFLKGLFAMGARGEMQDAQQNWLKTRRQCGSRLSCLNQAYDSRLKQLDKIYAGINKPL